MMDEYVTRYAARITLGGSLEVDSAYLKKCPKSWLAVGATTAAFDCRTRFDAGYPPGHASPKKAAEAWIEQQERKIDSLRQAADDTFCQIMRVREERADLLAAK